MDEDKKPPTLKTVCEGVCVRVHARVYVCVCVLTRVYLHMKSQMKTGSLSHLETVIMNGVYEQRGENTDSESDGEMAPGSRKPFLPPT